MQELAGFARVKLRPGEEKTVQFRLELSQLAFLDEEMRWKVEHGDIRICVGSSSEDIRLEDTITVTEDAFLEGKDRAFWAETAVWYDDWTKM